MFKSFRYYRRYYKFTILTTITCLIYIFLEDILNIFNNKNSNQIYDNPIKPNKLLPTTWPKISTNLIKKFDESKKCSTNETNFYTDLPPIGKLKHVHEVLTTVFKFDLTSLKSANLLWFWYFPFSKKYSQVSSKNLDKSTIINSVPGANYFTTKEYFVTHFKRNYIPEAFSTLTDQNLGHLENFKWAVKHNDHRGIKLYKKDDIKKLILNKSLPEKTFLQRFIDNPLLIDGYKFDVALYVVLTNQCKISPIPKIEIFGEWLLRFCPQPYNEDHIDGYVIHDDYRHPSLMDSLNFDVENYNGKAALLDYFRLNEKPLHKSLSGQFDKIIVDVVKSHNFQVKGYSENFCKNKTQSRTEMLEFKFFELVRFDFIIDQNHKVWLMEVNMSPNLDSGHFSANAVLYRNVIEWAINVGYVYRC